MDLITRRRGLMSGSANGTPFKYVLSISVENSISTTLELRNFLDNYIERDGKLYTFIVKNNASTSTYACRAGLRRDAELATARNASFTTTVSAQYDAVIAVGSTIEIYEVMT